MTRLGARTSPGSGAACRASRTRRCSAARAASSTTSSPVRTRRPRRDRALAARARPDHASTPRPRSRCPGVVGVLTGADVAALSRPFPAGIDSGVAVLRGRDRHRPLRRRAGRRRRRRDRYLAEDAAELVEVDYDPLEPVLDPVAGRAPCTSARSRYGDVDEALAARRRRRPRDVPLPALHVHARSSATASSPTGEADGTLTAWANFQGPFTLHARRGRGARAAAASKLRLLTPPDSGGSFGIKSSVFAYVVLMGLASRKLGVPVRWTEDRLEHLAGERRRRPGASTELEAGVRRRRRAARAPLRRDRGRRRVRARARAGDALPHARLALRRLPRRERRRAQPRRAHEPLPDRAQPRLRRPAALLRARADDGDRGAAARPRPGRAAPPQPRARRRVPVPDAVAAALYDSGDYEACLDDALELVALRRARAPSERARADGRLVGIGLACVVEPSISNMGYITLAQTADERAADAAEVGQRRGLHRSRSTRSAGSRCGSRRRRRARATGPSARRSSPTCSAVEPERRRGAVRDGHVDERRGRSPPGNYSSRFSGVGVGRGAPRPR